MLNLKPGQLKQIIEIIEYKLMTISRITFNEIPFDSAQCDRHTERSPRLPDGQACPSGRRGNLFNLLNDADKLFKGVKMTIYLVSLSVIIAMLSSCSGGQLPKESAETDKYPQIFPEYIDVTIPPNIAPLNFIIKEPGESFAVRISSKNGNDIKVSGKSPSIQINISDWNKMLALNQGEVLNVEVFCRNEGKWTKYKTIKHQISKDNIDSYLTYRLINSAYVLWFKMGLYQRNLENFDESPIIQNKSLSNACVNCHSLSKNNPEKFMFHIRSKFAGTLIYIEGKLEKVETKTDYTLASAAYGAWNPNGRHIAFSVNQINQNFYVFKDQSNEVSDKYSDLIVYDTQTKQITTSPKVSTRSRENLPEWSADGKYLFYISAPEALDDSARLITKYSLMGIDYDPEKNIWGEVDTIISARETGKSITFPRASPDGRFLVFCLTNYGYFTIHHKESDLCILDLKTGDYRVASEINSDETESYHSWSTNGRWLIFSSRRIDGVHTRTFIAHVDENGKFGKPFVLPQKNPDFYNNYLLNFNRPELMTGKIKVSPQKIRDAVRENAVPVIFDTKVNIDALSGASKIKKGN
jgi:Tol biopolymer transport system component